MAEPTATLQVLLAAIERLERKVDALTARLAEPPPAEAVGKREAARLLGVDRSTTLEQLLRNGRLRATRYGGRVRIARSEIQRFLEEPEAPRRHRAAAAPRRATTRRQVMDEAARLRALKIGDL
ncbi:DNA binding domain protein, excisionase family [Anaeromyxobacter dehalogenans 2CP-1]|uniref:DNA binding domain protein, excisionase family n=1 Tax=Anaeromyxobacter dehalogenans (strain ATCC BAA-258 / DSM 21875 / 2CP-1) TaxID=455488 RepID=B8JHP5_ANAD2|nr:helix-turn-helix domain-containing protein [Anaeromyxobacter dehalogenans]ACL66757.1 DNA binding domain protein, excisionase family [Anaeromyxobacter dehalogenans 2CP-1]